jgi:DNA-binding protein H-NS
MPRRLSIEVIRRRIAELEAKAKELQVKPGVAEVTQLIRKYKLTLADLREAFSAKRSAGRRPSKLRGKKAAVKYRDKKGNTWAGRGLAPKWIREAEKAGQKRDKFLVKT